MNRLLQRFPSLPYVAPFAVFLAFLALGSGLPVGQRANALLFLALPTVALFVFSRGIVSWRAPFWFRSVLLGVVVFLLWIAPDLLFPDWRGHWLFSNWLTGKSDAALTLEGQSDPLVLALRTLRAAALVPVVEELFWRGWLPRWIDNVDDFRKSPLGSFSRLAFWLTAILFASEHGPMWEVGLMAGVLYNWWMQKTRSLGDLILAHAVTNACLSAYVISAGKWEYW